MECETAESLHKGECIGFTLCPCLQFPGQRSPGWESFQTFRFSGSSYIWFIWEVFSVLLRTYTGKTYTTAKPQISWVVSLDCVPVEAAQVAAQASEQKQSRPVAISCFWSILFFFFPINPEGVLSALLWICTSFSVWRCLRKGIWKVCQHYELLYYN